MLDLSIYWTLISVIMVVSTLDSGNSHIQVLLDNRPVSKQYGRPRFRDLITIQPIEVTST